MERMSGEQLPFYGKEERKPRNPGVYVGVGLLTTRPVKQENTFSNNFGSARLAFAETRNETCSSSAKVAQLVWGSDCPPPKKISPCSRAVFSHPPRTFADAVHFARANHSRTKNSTHQAEYMSEYTQNEKLSSTNITEAMQTAYIDYSMSVIVARALPDARDGLKPVQRRILYAMHREGLHHNRPFTKCAGVVGEVLKHYHPHGDASVYDTLVRLAQDWVMRYPLIIPQGNFGSVEGDPAAAYRYTESKLAEISSEILADLDEDTVDFIPNYNESTTEPTVLPCGLPHLLMNGSEGIAVGMTTKVPPHNLGELVEVACRLMDNPNLSFDEIEKIVLGPDFPTGGVINGREGISQYIRTGRGLVRTRGVAHTEELKGGKEQIIITEIPYAVNRATLIERIAELIKEKIIDEATDIRNESDENCRIVIELKRGESPRVVINKLFKHTPLESTFGVILLALDKRRPKQMNLREMLECFIEHRRDVITRRTKFRLQKAEDRAHILEGFRIAIRNLDDFVKIIRSSSNRDEAREKLIAKYALSERQANAILDLRLYQLTGLEIDKIEEEYRQVLATIEYLRDILANEAKLLAIVKTELRQNSAKYITPRRTRIQAAEGEMRIEDIVANEGCIITVSHEGFIKRTTISSYRAQKRGGKGLIGAETHEADFIEHLFTASTHDTVMFFMNNGRVYVEKAYEIPEGTRATKGRSLKNVLELQDGETLAAMVCIKEFSEDQFLIFATAKGMIKKTRLSEYANCRKNGLIAVNIKEGDLLIAVRHTQDKGEVIMVSELGMSIRFPVYDEKSDDSADDDADTTEDDTEGDTAAVRVPKGIRLVGRAAAGVRGMKLAAKDTVRAMEIVDPDCTLLIAATNGIGKRTLFDDNDGPIYRIQSRGGKGLIAVKLRAGARVAGALSVRDGDEVMLLTKGGQAIRTRVKEIRQTGRNAQGVKLMDLDKDEQILDICKVVRTDEDVESADTQPELPLGTTETVL
jgi:DNA gyrase subunit A